MNYYDLKIMLGIWWNNTLSPSNPFCKLSKIYKAIKYTYQTLTPFMGHCRKLVYIVEQNWNSKLLDSNMWKTEIRSRSSEPNYYKLTTYFGRIKFYKTVYIKDGKQINLYVSGIIPALCGEDVEDKIKVKSLCLYSGWGFTKNQALKAFNVIKEKSPDLEWDGKYCDEFDSYYRLQAVLQYLKTNHAYFSLCKKDNPDMTQEEIDINNEREMREEICSAICYLKNKKKYMHGIKQIMFIALNPKSHDRDKELMEEITAVLNRFSFYGYKYFYKLWM